MAKQGRTHPLKRLGALLNLYLRRMSSIYFSGATSMKFLFPKM